MLLISVVGCAVAASLSPVLARETVVLPNVVGPVGEVSGVDTQGPGTLTVGAQDINTSNDAGGGITTTAANTAIIVFTDSSIVTGFVGTVGSTFLNIDAGANGETVTFSGPVYSTTFSVSGTGTVNFDGGFTSNTGSTMDFAGDGFINVAAGQTVLAAITNSAGAQTGTLTLNSNSILDGAVGAASGLKLINVVGGNALITGQAHAATFNLATNTLNIAGALALPAAGVINTTIFSETDYGQIVPVGAATIGNNLQINVTVTGLIANGTSFNIVDATSGTTGSVVIATSMTPSYAFSAAPSTAGLVTITTTQIPLVVVIGPGPGPVVPVIAPVIDALPVTPDTQPVLDAIAALPTPAAVTDALAQLAPAVANLAAPHVIFRATERFQDLMLAHLDGPCGQGRPEDRREIRRETAEACEPEDLRPHFWASVSGYYGDQDNEDGFEGYDSRVVGGTVAFDVPLSATAHTGVGVTYLRSTLDAETYENDSDIESYQVTAFLRYAPDDWFINGFLTYGMDDYESTRRILFPGVDETALADYSGHQYTALAATGYHFYLDDEGTILTPAVTLQYTRLHVDAYTETGAGAINLDTSEQNYDFVQAGIGAKLARDYVLSGGDVVRPELHARWLHSLGDDTMTNTATFTGGGPAFTVDGLQTDANLYEVGLGLVFVGDETWSLETGYDYHWNSENYAAQRAMLTLAMTF